MFVLYHVNLLEDVSSCCQEGYVSNGVFRRSYSQIYDEPNLDYVYIF
jgi:hypothetical protein